MSAASRAEAVVLAELAAEGICRRFVPLGVYLAFHSSALGPDWLEITRAIAPGAPDERTLRGQLHLLNGPYRAVYRGNPTHVVLDAEEGLGGVWLARLLYRGRSGPEVRTEVPIRVWSPGLATEHASVRAATRATRPELHRFWVREREAEERRRADAMSYVARPEDMDALDGL